jgi:hypothetical protein
MPTYIFSLSYSLSRQTPLALPPGPHLRALNDFAKGRNDATCVFLKWSTNIYKETEYPCFATLVADALYLRSDRARYEEDVCVNSVVVFAFGLSYWIRAHLLRQILFKIYKCRRDIADI